MRPPKYALEPLARVREKKVDEAVHGLAVAIAQVGDAEGERCATEARQRAHERTSERVRSDEAAALARGELRALDLAWAGAWGLGAAAEHKAIAAEVRLAREHETQAREGERQARDRVAATRADAEVVARDRARWNERLRRRAEAGEEEAASEAWRPRR
jgi:hypothetical protein